MVVVWRGLGGRAGGLSFSRSLRRRAARQGVGVSPGSGARGAQEGRRRVEKDHPEVVRWLGSRRRPPSWRSAVSVAAVAGAALWRRASTKVFRSTLLPPASCLLPPAPTTRLAGGLCGERAPKFDLPSPARLACWRAVTRKCARRSEMKGGSVDRCIEASQ